MPPLTLQHDVLLMFPSTMFTLMLEIGSRYLVRHLISVCCPPNIDVVSVKLIVAITFPRKTVPEPSYLF